MVNTDNTDISLVASRDTLRRLLSSKAAIERHLLDLGVQNMYGKNMLHYLVVNRDKHNIKLFLNILEDSGDALNAVDGQGMSPLMQCLVRNQMEEAEVILSHPKAQDKLKLENADADGKTLIHQAAERGNFAFWSKLTALDSCNLLIRDDAGNTPLMGAAKTGQNSIIRSWLAKQTNKPTNLMLVAAQNNDGYNLFMLVLMHLETEVVQKMITTLDLGSCIDQRDRDGNNALLLAAISEQWPVLKSVLSNNKLDELAIDIHPKNKDGHTTLVLVLAASVKISKQIQNYKMKNDKVNEKKMEAEADLLWDIVRLLLEKERALHGTSPAAGKEAGIASLKQQMESHKQIKSPLPEEVIDEFSKLYMVKIKAKKKPQPVPEIPKEEPKKVLAVSSFQQQMNAIYQQSVESDKKKSEESPKLKMNGSSQPKMEPSPASQIKKSEENKSKAVPQPSPVKPTREEKVVKKKEPSPVIPTREEKVVKKKEPSPPEEEAESGPSIDEIRAQWKKNRNTEKKEVKMDNFDLNSVMEDIMRKAEMKAKDATNTENVVEETKVSDEDSYVTESMNEEIQWALEQKKQHQQENGLIEVVSSPPKIETKCDPPAPPAKVSPAETKIVEKTNGGTEKENILNLVEIMEQKAEAKKAARIAKEQVKTKEELKKKEEMDQQYLDDAMDEEIRWAYEQKAAMLAEKRKEEEEELARKRKEEEDNKALSAIAERYRAKEAAKAQEKDDLVKKQNEEKERLEKLQRDAEAKMKALKEAKEKAVETPVDDEMTKLPRWKREKLLRERRSSTATSNGDIFNKSPGSITENKPESSETKSVENEDNAKRESRKDSMTNGSAFSIGRKIHDEDEGNEDPYLASRLDEEIRWAQELSGQAQREKEETERKEYEKIQQEREAEAEKQRLAKLKEEQAMIEALEQTAKQKLLKKKEAEEKRVQLEKEEEQRRLQLKKAEAERLEKEKKLEEKRREMESVEKAKKIADSQNSQEGLDKKRDEFLDWLQNEVEEAEVETPPAPVRRRRTANANEDQDQAPAPVIPNRRSRTNEREEHQPGVRSVGVSVDIRPGYADASTQTDPVQTCDFAV